MHLASDNHRDRSEGRRRHLLHHTSGAVGCQHSKLDITLARRLCCARWQSRSTWRQAQAIATSAWQAVNLVPRCACMSRTFGEKSVGEKRQSRQPNRFDTMVGQYSQQQQQPCKRLRLTNGEEAGSLTPDRAGTPVGGYQAPTSGRWAGHVPKRIQQLRDESVVSVRSEGGTVTKVRKGQAAAWLPSPVLGLRTGCCFDVTQRAWGQVRLCIRLCAVEEAQSPRHLRGLVSPKSGLTI